MSDEDARGRTSARGLVCEVRAKGGKGFYWQVVNPAAIPRVGEIVVFSDADASVESVRWEPPPRAGGAMKVVVECVVA